MLWNSTCFWWVCSKDRPPVTLRKGVPRILLTFEGTMVVPWFDHWPAVELATRVCGQSLSQLVVGAGISQRSGLDLNCQDFQNSQTFAFRSLHHITRCTCVIIGKQIPSDVECRGCKVEIEVACVRSCVPRDVENSDSTKNRDCVHIPQYIALIISITLVYPGRPLATLVQEGPAKFSQ